MGLGCKTMKIAAVVGLMTGALAAPGWADFDLQITEIWPGNEPGANLSEDWFEVTNFGDMAWTAAVNGDLYFDDESFDETTADLMSGVDSIAPGESVIFVNGGEDGAAEWIALWSPDITLPQVGSYNGAGLSQGGDAVGLFLDIDANGPDADELFETQAYPDANLAAGGSYDVLLGQFSTVGNAAGAVATTTLNDVNQPVVGSPGSIVPEPTTAGLIIVASGLLALRRHA